MCLADKDDRVRYCSMRSPLLQYVLQYIAVCVYGVESGRHVIT